jgi:hypothetical protein
MLLRRFQMVGVGALLAFTLLLATDVPGAVMLVTTAVLVCVGMHFVAVQREPDGRDLLETTQRAGRRPEK